MSNLSTFFPASITSSPIGVTWNVIEDNITALPGTGYLMNTSGGPLTLILPPSPNEGTQVGVGDYAGTFSTYNVTVSGNGSKIEGSDDDRILNVDNININFIFTNSVNGWVPISSANEVSVQSKPFMRVVEQQDNGDDSDFSSTNNNYGDRVLNLVKDNSIDGASLAANVVTLPAGEFYLEANCSANSAGDNYLVIRDSSNNILLIGPVEAGGGAVSHICGTISLSASTNIKLSHYTQDNGGGGGSSANVKTNTSDPHIFADFRIWQLDALVQAPRVYKPLNQPVTGVNTTDGIFGGNVVWEDVDEVSIEPFSCMSDDLGAELAETSATTVALSGKDTNTIYNVFAVKYTFGSIGVELDTDINGSNIQSYTTHKRWLGFVRTNGDKDFIKFIQIRDYIYFGAIADMVFGNVSSTSWTSFSLASFFPVSRVDRIMFGAEAATYNSCNIHYSLDSVTDYGTVLQATSATSDNDDVAEQIFVPYYNGATTYFRRRAVSGDVDVGINAVRIIR